MDYFGGAFLSFLKLDSPGHHSLSIYEKHSAKFLTLGFMTGGSVNHFWANYPFKTLLELERYLFLNCK